MRRKEREVTDRETILGIMKDCDVCRLAFNTDDGYPYVVPLNFGMVDDGESVTLYFHSAMEGRKADLMKADPRVSFEMDCRHQLQGDPERGYCTMAYGCVMGHGVIEIVPDEEKLHALEILCGQYYPNGFPFNPAALSRTLVYRLKAEGITAKQKI